MQNAALQLNTPLLCWDLSQGCSLSLLNQSLIPTSCSAACLHQLVLAPCQVIFAHDWTGVVKALSVKRLLLHLGTDPVPSARSGPLQITTNPRSPSHRIHKGVIRARGVAVRAWRSASARDGPMVTLAALPVITLA